MPAGAGRGRTVWPPRPVVPAQTGPRGLAGTWGSKYGDYLGPRGVEPPVEWLPPLGVTPALEAYAIVAVAMVAVEVYLLYQILPRTGRPPTMSHMVIGSSALLGSAAFLLALLDFVFFPDSYSAATVVLWGLNFMMFAPPGLWVVAVIVYHDRLVDGRGWWWPALIASAATGAEIIMGLLFSVSNPVPVLTSWTVGQSLVSPWFDWSMAAAMAALVLWVPLSRVEREGLATLIGAAAVAPWIGASPLLGAVLMTAVMALAFALLYRRFEGTAGLSVRETRVLLAVGVAFLVMTISEWGNLAVGGAVGLLVFGILSTLVMATDLAYLAHRALSARASDPGVHAPEDPDLPAASPASAAGGGSRTPGGERGAGDAIPAASAAPLVASTAAAPRGLPDP